MVARKEFSWSNVGIMGLINFRFFQEVIIHGAKLKSLKSGSLERDP